MKAETKVYDQRFLELFDPNEPLIWIASDLISGEGPIWHRQEKCLYFSNIGGSKTMRYNEADGLQVAFHNGVKTNGMFVDLDGNLLMCEYATSSLTVRKTDGTKRRVLADYYNGVELNSPNDVVQRSDGLIYFTDPVYGRGSGLSQVPRPIPSELRPVYCYNPKTKGLRPVHVGFDTPNGLCFSLDEKILYVNNTNTRSIYAFDCQPDGTLTNQRLLAAVNGLPDGQKIDERGNLVIAAADGGIVWLSADGTPLGVILIPGDPLNLAWGEEDYKTLYVCCRDRACKLRTLVAGHKCC